MKKNKKLLLLASAILIVISLAACSEKKEKVSYEVEELEGYTLKDKSDFLFLNYLVYAQLTNGEIKKIYYDSGSDTYSSYDGNFIQKGEANYLITITKEEEEQYILVLDNDTFKKFNLDSINEFDDTLPTYEEDLSGIIKSNQ